MTQGILPFFSDTRAEVLKQIGLEIAAARPSRQIMLQMAQVEARKIASYRGPITSDDLVAHYCAMGIDLPRRLGNAMGAIFSGPAWRWTGEVRKSCRVSRRAGLLRVWRLER